MASAVPCLPCLPTGRRQAGILPRGISMDFDIWLKQLPLIGIFFERTYAYWQGHVAFANTTHIIFGASIALLIFSKRKRLGIFLLFISIALHIVAFLG